MELPCSSRQADHLAGSELSISAQNWNRAANPSGHEPPLARPAVVQASGLESCAEIRHDVMSERVDVITFCAMREGSASSWGPDRLVAYRDVW